jgi:hypothetical protein
MKDSLEPWCESGTVEDAGGGSGGGGAAAGDEL